MQHLDSIEGRQLAPGLIAKLVHGAQSTLSVVDIQEGCVMNIHQHVHEQITYVVEGELEMTIDGKQYVLTPGMTHVIPPNTPHGAYARTHVKVIDFFSPARDDYR